MYKRSKADKDTIKAWKFFCTDCLKVDYTYIRFVGGENQHTHIHGNGMEKKGFIVVFTIDFSKLMMTLLKTKKNIVIFLKNQWNQSGPDLAD